MNRTQTSSDQWGETVRRAQNLDPESFDPIVEEFAPRVRGFLRRFVPEREVDDLVQEVFLRMVRSIKSYQDNGKFEAWVFQIARNLARDQMRRNERGLMVQDESSEQYVAPESSPQFDSHPYDSDAVESIEAALMRLPEAEREVILLRHFARLPFEEIARIMATPLGTALARSHRGLTNLRRMMEERL